MTTTAAPPPYVPPLSPRRPPLPDIPPRRGLYRCMKALLRVVFRLLLDLRVERVDLVPSSGPVLLAANHRSFLDAPLVNSLIPRPASFLAKSELFRGPLVRFFMWLGQIPVDRGRVDREALRRALAVLQGGEVLGLFPEGSRGAGDLTQVQHGIGYLALRVPGVPIVPIACVGTDRAMPVGSRSLRRGTTVHVVFGEPFTVDVPPNPRSRAAVAKAAEEIRLALAAHVAHVDALVARAAAEDGAAAASPAGTRRRRGLRR